MKGSLPSSTITLQDGLWLVGLQQTGGSGAGQDRSLLWSVGDILPMAELLGLGSLSGSLLMCVNIWQLPGLDLWDPTGRCGGHPPAWPGSAGKGRRAQQGAGRTHSSMEGWLLLLGRPNPGPKPSGNGISHLQTPFLCLLIQAGLQHGLPAPVPGPGTVPRLTVPLTCPGKAALLHCNGNTER